MTEHIGIVAATAEGASLCYRTICAEGPALLGGYSHPEVSMHTPSFAAYAELLERDDWDGIGDLMLQSASKLEAIGADLFICPDNTFHRAFARVEAGSSRPWLHIAEEVARSAEQRGLRRVGLTGTRWLVDSDVYPQKLAARGIEYSRPSEDERTEISRIIMEELVRGDFRPSAVEYFQGVISRMKSAGCDAVVLGCTEIPLLINDDNSPLPTLDSTRLLARAALRRAVGG
jgi:aspartate racemase